MPEVVGADDVNGVAAELDVRPALAVAHVVPSIAEEASGPSSCVPGLCEALVRKQVRVSLHVLSAPHGRVLPGVELSVHPRWELGARFGVSFDLVRELRGKALETEIIHNHGLWMMPNIAAGMVSRSNRLPRLVISPHGTLGPATLLHHRWRKRLLWHAGQKLVLSRASCFHATCEAEAIDIRRLGFRQPIAIIPNGIRITTRSTPTATSSRRRLVFMGRLHPIKAIDRALRAWAQVEQTYATGTSSSSARPATTATVLPSKIFRPVSALKKSSSRGHCMAKKN